MRARAIAVVVVLLGSSWAAVVQAQVCKGAMALRVNESGLAFIGEQVRPLIPSKLDLPAVAATVVDWPLTESDATVNFAWGKADLQLKDLQLTMEDKTLRVFGKADVSTGGPLSVDNPYVGLGSANCEGDVQIKDLTIDLRLHLDTTGGKINAEVTKARITIDNGSTVIALTGCTLGNILTKVVDFLRKHFMGTIEKKVEALAKDKIRPLVESKLAGTIQLSKEVQGFVFTGRLDALNTDLRGVSVDLGAGVHLKQLASPPCLAGKNLSAPTGCGQGAAQLATSVDAMFGAGLSQGVLNSALHAVWRSGKLCIASNDPALQATLGPSLSKVGATLGQPAGTKLDFALQLNSAPQLKLTPGGGVELLIQGFGIRLAMTPPGGPLNQTSVEADLSVTAKPWIDPAGNTIALDLSRVAISRLEIKNADGTPAALQLDPARIQRFISDVALPVLRTRLGASPLSPAVMNVQSYQVELKSVVIGDANLAAYVNAYALKPSGDKGQPQTSLVNAPGQEVGPQVIRLLVKGSDNRTPASLLRFRHRMDGGPWSEPAYGGRIDVATHGGAHLVEVAAVDHDGNIDATPLALPFKVDDVMPQLQITSRPESMLESDRASVTFAGRDDRTPAEKLNFTALLFRVPDGGGNPRAVASRALTRGERAVTFEGLPDGVYKIRVVVADGVGNVTSQDVGFVVVNTGGCAISSGSAGAPTGLLLLLALGLLLRAFRRRG
jgi:hypothetical protein